jgi:hypothetical protein
MYDRGRSRRGVCLSFVALPAASSLPPSQFWPASPRWWAQPQPDQLKGLAFFGDTAEEAERVAHAYLMAEAAN